MTLEGVEQEKKNMDKNKKRNISLLIINSILLTICSVAFVILLIVTISLFATPQNGTSFPKTYFVPHLFLLLVFIISQGFALIVETKMLKKQNISPRYCAKKICWINIAAFISWFIICLFLTIVFLSGKTLLSIRITSVVDWLIMVFLTVTLLIYPIVCSVVFIRDYKLIQASA